MTTPEVHELLDLSAKTAVVTGAGRGIGTAIARRLAEAGADVAIGYRTSGAPPMVTSWRSPPTSPTAARWRGRSPPPPSISAASTASSPTPG